MTDFQFGGAARPPDCVAARLRREPAALHATRTRRACIDLAIGSLLLRFSFRRRLRPIPLGFALLGFFLQLLELLRLFGARLAIAFRTLLTVIRLEGHGRSFPGILARKISIRTRRSVPISQSLRAAS